MKKKFLIMLCLVLPAMSQVTAQNLDKGKWYISQKQYETARKIFQSLLDKKTGDSAKVLYQLGLVYDFKGKTDSAEYCYQLGAKVDEKYAFNYLGMGKEQLNKSNKTEWFKYYDKGRKLSKNTFEYNLEAGRVCLLTTTQNFDLCSKYLEEAKLEDAKNCNLLIGFGDLYLASKSPGDAVNEYERAVYFDKKCVTAYVKLGEVYAKANNFRDAVNAYNQAIGLDTTLIIAYKERGDLFYTFAKYDEAKADYDIYMQRSEKSLADLERYAFILFFSKNYTQAKQLVSEVIQSDPNNTVMYRVAAYCDFETNDFQSSLTNIEHFFTHHDTSRFIALDYIYYGRDLLKNGQDSLGTIQLEAALKLDSTKTELYEEIGKSYSKSKQYQKAIDSYVKLLQVTSNNRSNLYYQIGRNFYFMAEDSLTGLDSLSKAEYYQEADCCFENMTAVAPDSYIGFIWRGRALSRLDPETNLGLAKPSYEKAMTLLEAGDVTKTQKLLIECYRYLAFYHFTIADKLLTKTPSEAKIEIANSIGYWTKISALDPTDQQAKTAIETLQKL